MKQVEQIEQTLAGWYEQLPHLPANGRKWLADNAWWLVAIGVALSVLGFLGMVVAWLLPGLLLVTLGGSMAGLGGAALGAMVGGVLFFAWLLSVVVYVIEALIMAKAITPLKARAKRGWTLMFYVVLLNAASVIIGRALSFDVFGLVFGLFWVAVGAYFLFEVRSLFGGTKKAVAATSKAPAPVEKKPRQSDEDEEEI